jgi:hypothetical protein
MHFTCNKQLYLDTGYVLYACIITGQVSIGNQSFHLDLDHCVKGSLIFSVIIKIGGQSS